MTEPVVSHDASADVAFRPARADDAERVAILHAESWRRHYRGAYSDAYLDGDVVGDRRTVWTERLSTPDAAHVTLVAEHDDAVCGFIHMVLDHDPRWGSLVDNLHVTTARQRLGIGAALITRAAQAVAGRGVTDAMYLWVQEQNRSAQAFYAAQGGQYVERAPIQAPGGVPGRLNGTPWKLRFAWADVRGLAER